MKKLLPLLLFGWLLASLPVHAQYFGHNKVAYDDINFEVVGTPHFNIYHYLENRDQLQEVATWAEHWYSLHQAVLQDTLYGKNPILLYNDHPDFQQTTAIGGAIGVGTGGVTEAFKNRVILPFAMSNQQTHHVLGHELVHAFQYNMIIRGDSTSIRNLSNLPLWMVEGLAEYLSIGSVDANTAMWMRDAVLQDDFPSIRKMSHPKYFPYRYGQAYWAFLTGLKGDDVIAPYFTATAQFGMEIATPLVLGMNLDDLDKLWVETMKQHFGEQLKDRQERSYGRRMFDDKKAGRLTISPEISPNDRYIMFLSEKNIFGIELFLADARNGKIIRRVSKTSLDGHIDDISYIESSGTWSPDSKRFAYVGVSKGDNILIVQEAETGRKVLETRLEGVPAFSNPAWSPDGKTIVVSGLVHGQVDLYQYHLSTQQVTQLTNDRYSELHPAWHGEGTHIAFSTDELSLRNPSSAGYMSHNLAELEVATGQTIHHEVFPGALNLNPEYDPNGHLLFLSDRDGYRNMYRLDPANGKVYQLTDFLTGVSGITPYSPAISVSRRRDRIVYTHYNDNSYTVYRANPDDFLQQEVDPMEVDQAAAQLPRVNRQAPLQVDQGLDQLEVQSTQSTIELVDKEYRSNFKLDYAGGSTGVGVGIGNNNLYGTSTGVAGGVDLLFSDITGGQQIYTSIALNGEIYDIGGAVAYINRANRWQWGAQISHIPTRFFDRPTVSPDTLPFPNGTVLNVARVDFNNIRLFQSQLMGFLQYPFSQAMRVEFGASAARYGYRVDLFQNYYDSFGRLLRQERERNRDLEMQLQNFALFNTQAALVGDNSRFGLTAPLQGHRYRIGIEKYFGDVSYTAVTTDLRFYRFFKPVGVAVRGWHYGRYGGNTDRLNPLYVGSPWFIRGYNSSVIQGLFRLNDRNFNDMFGDKVLVGNFELRIPFTGPVQLALLKSKFLFTDLNFFVDGGVAFYEFDQFGDNDPALRKAEPVFSAGASLRVNLFGAMMLEPYYARPLLKESEWVFGLNIFPGW